MKRVIFFGSSSFSVPFLEFLIKKTKLICVVTACDKPAGRGKILKPNIVKECALRLGIESILTPTSLKDDKFITTVSELKPDLIVVASYGKILPEELLKIPKFGTINIHPSLLPLYPGAEPIFWQIARGEKESGVSIFEMNSKIDKGEIILQEKIEISEEDNYADVENKLINTGLKLLGEVIDMLDKGLSLPKTKGEDIETFYARKLLPVDEKINWNKSSKEIVDKIRAFSPKIGAYTMFNGQRVKIFKAKREELKEGNLKPGTIVVKEKNIFVKTGDSFINIDFLKPEGKKIMKAFEFINGYLKDFNEPKFE